MHKKYEFHQGVHHNVELYHNVNQMNRKSHSIIQKSINHDYRPNFQILTQTQFHSMDIDQATFIKMDENHLLGV